MLRGSAGARRRKSPFCCLCTLEFCSDLLHCVQTYEKGGRKSEASAGAAVSGDVLSTDRVLVSLVFVLFTHSFSPLFTLSTQARSGSSCGGHQPEHQQQTPPPTHTPQGHLPHIPASWAIFCEGVWDSSPGGPGSPSCGYRDLTH